MNDTFIFGVGRSGTTMIYGLCQKIFSLCSNSEFRYFYEPFIWNPDLFDRPYEECNALFGKTSSINIEGIFSHMSIPLFIHEGSDLSRANSSFFETFRPTQDEKPSLYKIIRGNGRLKLFRQLNPTAKFLVIIRNPIDAVNSVKYKFDYFGSDFYPSDFDRFYTEIAAADNFHPEAEDISWAETQAEYVYQMNAAAVAFASGDEATMVIEYDSFVQDKSRGIEKLTNFLDLPTAQDYEQFLEQPIGPQTKNISLSEDEFTSIANYTYLHDKLCRRTGLIPGQSVNRVLLKYRDQCFGRKYDNSLDGLVTNALRRVIRQLEPQVWDSTDSKLDSQPE